MREDDFNYGVQREYKPHREPFPELRPSHAEISTSKERTWAALAHLSVFLNLLTGFLGPVAAGVLWLVFRDRSRTVASHALRSVVYQVIWLAVMTIGWPITVALIPFVIGIFLVPPMILISIAPFVYALRAAYEAYSGRSFHSFHYRSRWAACSHRGYRSSGSTHYI